MLEAVMVCAMFLLIILGAVVVHVLDERIRKINEICTAHLAHLTKLSRITDTLVEISGIRNRQSASLFEYIKMVEQSLDATDSFVYVIAGLLRALADRSGHGDTDTDHGETTAEPRYSGSSAYPDDDADNTTVPLPDDNNGPDSGTRVIHLIIRGEPGNTDQMYGELRDLGDDHLHIGDAEHADSDDDMDNVHGDDGRPYQPEGV